MKKFRYFSLLALAVIIISVLAAPTPATPDIPEPVSEAPVEDKFCDTTTPEMAERLIDLDLNFRLNGIETELMLDPETLWVAYRSSEDISGRCCKNQLDCDGPDCFYPPPPARSSQSLAEGGPTQEQLDREQEFKQFLAENGVTQEELDRAVSKALRTAA